MSNKTEWPKVVTSGNATVKVYRRTTGSGNVGFQIVYRDTNGKRKFESESDMDTALRLAKKKAETLSTFGARAAAASPSDMSEFVRLSDLLKPFNVSVTVACESVHVWLSEHKTLEALDRAIVAGPAASNGDTTPHTVAEVITEVLALKGANGLSAVYRAVLKSRLNKFAASFQSDVRTITTAQIQVWLDGLKLHAGTYGNMTKCLAVMFSHCVRRGYISKSPVEGIEKRKTRGAEILIYTPAEMAKLLNAATGSYVYRLAISAFAGLRTAELRRLTWDAVDFAGGHIIIGKDRAKTKTRRVVPMSDNLKAWLKPARGLTGSVSDAGMSTFWLVQKEVTTKAGVPWKNNGLRHSFCSYRLAATGDVARTAFEAGNSPAVIHGHYKALVTEAQAKEWFAIMPK